MALNWNHTDEEYLSPEDLNRIETYTKSLRDLLVSYGYYPSVTKRNQWQLGDFPSVSDIARIRANINALQNSFVSIPEWRDLVIKFAPTEKQTLDSDQLNAFEWDLQYILTWLERMVQSFLYFGEVYAGEVV